MLRKTVSAGRKFVIEMCMIMIMFSFYLIFSFRMHARENVVDDLSRSSSHVHVSERSTFSTPPNRTKKEKRNE